MNQLQPIILITLTFFILLTSCNNDSSSNFDPENNSVQNTLKSSAQFPIGSAMSFWRMSRDTALVNIHKTQFNSITAENSMKMASVARNKDTFNFTGPDFFAQYADENQMRLFGHALIWHSSTPAWMEEIKGDREKLDQFMKLYINEYVSRYKGKVDGWDVVNEVMETQGGAFRNTFWYQAFGIDYVDKAFRYAHAADPDAILFINDFNTERDTAKLNGMLNLVDHLIQKGTPISGIGMQMHIRMDIPNEIIAESLRKVAATGLQVHISELDIIFNKHNDSQGGGEQVYGEITESMLEDQAQKYYDVFKMYQDIVPIDQQYGITFWGFNDRDTWINGFFNLEDKPTIYDENLAPKPAYYKIIKALKEKNKS